MKRNRRIAIGAAVLLVGALTNHYVINNPKHKILPENIADYKEKLGDSISRLSDDDRRLLIQYAMRHGIAKIFGGNDHYEPITVGEAIEEQKAWLGQKAQSNTKEATLKAEVETEKKAKIEEVNRAITVSYLGKRFTKSDYRDFIEIKVAYQNNTQKDIAGIKGAFVFKDVFGDTLFRLNAGMDRTLKAGAKYVEEGRGLDYNQFNDEQRHFNATPDDKLRFEFVPAMIVFTDGSKVEIASEGE